MSDAPKHTASDLAVAAMLDVARSVPGGVESAREHVANALQIALCAQIAPLSPVDLLAIVGRLRAALAILDGDHR
jgi:hypothetical protein